MQNKSETIVVIMVSLFLIFIIVLMGWLLYDHLEKELETVGIGDTVYVLEVQENDDIIIRQGLVESVAFSDGIKYYIVKIAYRYDLVEFDIITYRYDSVFKTEKSAIKKNGGITRMKKNEL